MEIIDMRIGPNPKPPVSEPKAGGWKRGGRGGGNAGADKVAT